MRKYALDSNCYIDAIRETAARAALEAFTAREAPRLYLSTVVAAELQAGARSSHDRKLRFLRNEGAGEVGAENAVSLDSVIGMGCHAGGSRASSSLKTPAVRQSSRLPTT